MSKKVTSIYLGMLAVFAIGLWAILTGGSLFLRAPTDLAGDWTLQSSEEAETAASTVAMHVQQSGRYFRVSIDGKMRSLKLQSEHFSPESGQTEIRLSGEGLNLLLSGPAEADRYELEAQGLLSGHWIADRVNRVYPPRLRNRPTSKPA